MNHLEFARLESSAADTPADRAFAAFVEDVERLLGIDDLDGDREVDGYSIDDAGDAFEAGRTAGHYAACVRAALARQGRTPQNRRED